MWKKKDQNLREELFVRNSQLKFSLTLLILFFTAPTFGSHYFNIDSTLSVAQQYNYDLKLGAAKEILLGHKSTLPENSAVQYLLHFNAFAKAFVTEEQKDYAKYRQIQDEALFHFEKIPNTSPYKRFLQSEAYFYSATLKAKFNELYGAARDVNRAKSLIEDNHKLFPEFLPNNKTRGILKVYLSTVPDNYGWIIRMLGMEGDLSAGLRMLSNLAEHQADTSELGGIAQEAAYLYSFALLHVAKQPRKAWAETLKCTKDYKTNLISTFFRSNLALKLNKNETAIKILDKRPKSSQYQDFYFLDYQLGMAKLNNLEPDAINYLNSFHTNFKGRNYIKSALQKMSWYYVIFGNYDEAREYKSKIDLVGFSLNEEDKLAIHYSNKPLPNDILLKTRLLYDGGKFELASQEVKRLDPKTLNSNSEKAEYAYRRGRIAEKLNKMAAALKYYEACSLFAIESEEYYGAYACINLGDYYLKNSDNTNAKKFYEKALEYRKNREYLESIEHRAKVGLKKT